MSVIFWFRADVFQFRQVIFQFRVVIFQFRAVIFLFRVVIFRFRAVITSKKCNENSGLPKFAPLSHALHVQGCVPPPCPAGLAWVTA